MEFLSKQMQKLREESGLKQKDVAERLSIKTDAYKNYESKRSNPSMDMLICLSKLYNVSISYLLGMEMDKGHCIVQRTQNHFSENLRKMRKGQKLSAREFGNEIGISGRMVSYYEAGEKVPKLERLMQIARFFQVSVDELIN